MTQSTRPASYTGQLQRLEVTSAMGSSLHAYLWGGGGGGGGADYPGNGGNGSGGGFAEVSFPIQTGDIIEVAVGGGGGAGISGTAGSGGGSAGSSYISQSPAESYSGSLGGNPGPVGISGGGGGGGGATVLFKNGVVLAVAGGGGGGGGGGNRGTVAGGNAPGTAGRASPPVNNGQNGGNNQSDGGGGGGGGGGYGGGNGGQPIYYDQGGSAGSAGGNYGDSTEEPSSTQPGNATSVYRFGKAGTGGAGSISNGARATAGISGQATLVFDIVGVSVKDDGQWKSAITYIKDGGIWKEVQEIYVKQNGEWKLVAGTDASAPNFTNIGTTNFGVISRNNP